MVWMFQRFSGPDSYYSHGFIVPFVTAWLIWDNRKKIEKTQDMNSVWGLLLILFALSLHILGTVLYIFSISGLSIFFLVIGLALFFYGKDFLRINFVPFLFLLFMLPLPGAFITKISFPLKMFVAKISVIIVSLIGVPIFREGFNIIIPSGNLVVGNPCSGIRSLIAFMALGFIIPYFSSASPVKKMILFLMSIPVAILSNLIRVPSLVLIAHFWGLEAASSESFLHTASGIISFAIGFVIILNLGRLLEWKK